jgi:hypothetical protein
MGQSSTKGCALLSVSPTSTSSSKYSLIPRTRPARLFNNRVVPVPDQELQSYCAAHKCELACCCGRAAKIYAPPNLNPDPENPIMWVIICDAPAGKTTCPLYCKRQILVCVDHLLMTNADIVTRFRKRHCDDPIYMLMNPFESKSILTCVLQT